MKDILDLLQIGGQQDILSSLISLIWLMLLMSFFLYPGLSQKIQLSYMLRDLERKLNRLKAIDDDVKDRTIKTLQTYAPPEIDVKNELEKLLDSFIISPESMDPYGIVYKLEHIVNTWEDRFEEDVVKICKKADNIRVKTLTNLVEVARGVHFIYRFVRHYYLLGKRTSNIYLILQIQMLMPQIMEIANAYRQASYAFIHGQPIGDGIGVLSVARLAYGREKKTYEIAKDTIAHELDFEGRRLILVRASGPGGTVGRPGEGVQKIVEAEGDKVKLIITIDAGLKLEGEESGKVVEGVGVAIGGTGVDKYRIEEIAKAKGTPLYAIVIYESITEAITPMREAIAKAADKVIEKVKQTITEKVESGSTVIVAGIGNSVGIGIT
ncbi:MAG: DUF1512 domain-containing protein [Aigarchaeota archaeon]|nr:DUF1512 domain-containing protein [Aigarchaeota archaeon]MCX8192432.1 DUF1512 domain-containing protein [Nitrososphaeria archaeon]MDW7986638.1 DUF1512 domain-containing protein [Nitrososphaerota archaeon]